MNDVIHEVEIEIRGDEFCCRFGAISSAPFFVDGVVVNPSVPPLMIVLPQDLGAALAPGGDETFGGVVSTATADGFFRVDSSSGLMGLGTVPGALVGRIAASHVSRSLEGLTMRNVIGEKRTTWT